VKSINLIYLSPWSVGGFTSFTAHLQRCLVAEGVNVTVLRCNRDREERVTRVMKGHELSYRNVSVATAVRAAKTTPTLITAVARPDDLADKDTIHKLLKAGAMCCVQSTQEFKQFPHVTGLKPAQVVVIRESLQKHFKGSAYLPHPYSRVHGKLSDLKGRQRACSLSMVATNKHPDIICKANESLPAKFRVEFVGKETTHFLGLKLKQKYPSYKKPKGFRCSQDAARLAAGYQMAVDLSDYPHGDGGGTQYSFLEAMDAGTVNVIHTNWADKKGDMQEFVNCLAVHSDDDLANILRNVTVGELNKLRKNALDVLEAHGSAAIVKRLRRIM